ncbi:DHH family phosphoesterase [archaeon]|nr:DHH family phosphoesterase [archaeon]
MKSELAQVAKEIKNLNYVIRVISHLDTDGITSAAIISKALKRENKLFCLSIIKQLSEEELEILKKEVYDIFIFTDLGAGQLENIIKFFPEKRIIILDHHE